MRVVLALLVVTLLQQPSRDAAPLKPAVGTGVIKGRVVADDGTPVRRAIVTIGAENVPPQSIYTDSEGRYEARRLPAGSYRVNVRPNNYQAQFLQPLAPAVRVKPVPLAEGQTIEWYDLTLRRAGAIVGRVVDQHGDPVSGIQVQAQRAGRTGMDSWASQSSDEFGRFRVYRLEPGEYEVFARPFSGLSDRIPGQNVGFVETYYPNTLSRQEATRVTVRAGQDTSISELQLVSARLLRVSGVLVGASSRTGSSPMVSLYSEKGGGMGRSADADGRFSFDPQMPGSYRLSAQLLSDNREAVLAYASMPLTLSDTDVEDVTLTLKPTVTLTGRVVYEDAGILPASTGLVIRADPPQRDAALPLTRSPASVGEDLTFTLHHLAGELLLRPGGSTSGTWSLKTILLGTEDITDVPREFRAEDSGHIQIVLTSRWAQLSGKVVGDKGEPVTGRTALLFSEDRSAWFAESSRMRAAFIQDSAFVMGGLRPGRYYVTVLPANVRWDFQQIDKGFLEKLAAEATPIVIGEDERREVILRAATGG